ncbi:hypothetical protein BC938DRAFT_473837, partial [Jimgerdemannia flammicorona]
MSNQSYSWYIYWVSILTTVGAFMFGFDTVVCWYFRRSKHVRFELWNFDGKAHITRGWETGNTFGRKVTILYASLVFVVGVIMQAAATN